VAEADTNTGAHHESLQRVTTQSQLSVGPPLLPDALHFILETLVLGISPFRVNEMQNRKHISSAILWSTFHKSVMSHPPFSAALCQTNRNRRHDAIGRCLFAQSR
jgi:hypothetical protein